MVRDAERARHAADVRAQGTIVRPRASTPRASGPSVAARGPRPPRQVARFTPNQSREPASPFGCPRPTAHLAAEVTVGEAGDEVVDEVHGHRHVERSRQVHQQMKSCREHDDHGDALPALNRVREGKHHDADRDRGDEVAGQAREKHRLHAAPRDLFTDSRDERRAHPERAFRSVRRHEQSGDPFALLDGLAPARPAEWDRDRQKEKPARIARTGGICAGNSWIQLSFATRIETPRTPSSAGAPQQKYLRRGGNARDSISFIDLIADQGITRPKRTRWPSRSDGDPPEIIRSSPRA